MTLLISFLLFPGDSDLTVVEIQKLSPVSAGDSMSLPVEIVIDKENRLYLLDAGAKCIFVWNEDGSFLTRLGREGDGPGEFRFMDPGRCEMAYDGEQVIVLDDKALKWHTFKGTQFQETTLKDNKRARIGFFKCLPNGKYVIWEQEHRGAIPWSKIYITDKHWRNQTILLEYEDRMFKKNDQKGWDVNPAAPIPIIHADYYCDVVVVGNAVAPEARVFDLDGKLIKTMLVGLTPQPFTSADKEDTLKTYKWLKPPHRPIWPEYRMRYSLLFYIDGNLLTCRNSPSTGAMEGVLIDEHGRRKSFKHSFGDNGGTVLTKDIFVGIYNDAEGEFSVKKLAIR